MKVVHQGFSHVENAHTKIGWLIKVKLCLHHMNGNEASSKIVQQSKFGLAASFWANLSHDINRISIPFLIFSSVLPKTELFIILKKSISKLFPDCLASIPSFAFRLMYSSSHALLLNRGFRII